MVGKGVKKSCRADFTNINLFSLCSAFVLLIVILVVVVEEVDEEEE